MYTPVVPSGPLRGPSQRPPGGYKIDDDEGFRASALGSIVQAVRSCVLIKPRPKKFPMTASYGHLVTRASPKILGRFIFFGAPLASFFSESEAFLTKCPYEADGENFFLA